MDLKRLIGAIVAAVVVCVAGGMAGCPAYNVWSARKAGEAELAQATANRMIKVQEAEATRESAIKLADAEWERARGAARAAKEIGESLKGNEEYLRYLWLHSLDTDKGKDVIYIPTEANLPLLEASRFSRTSAAPAQSAPPPAK